MLIIVSGSQVTSASTAEARSASQTPHDPEALRSGTPSAKTQRSPHVCGFTR